MKRKDDAEGTKKRIRESKRAKEGKGYRRKGRWGKGTLGLEGERLGGGIYAETAKSYIQFGSLINSVRFIGS